ncbi:hypothetical protein AKJ57_01895 [candidate division MSBL1 archaeon SCGC-AAA259A05]|uniref:Uncharacterized protein n=1 Tax=candidate division MSBL1 archaeon SCGC-AAA259A05 TaxID=1698259 RepID=A0A133UAP5_9EURY|nr:hypothetical protein AKJ57_01895 [candidate division MSBL1 archaeon SCGC-AAA259A05]
MRRDGQVFTFDMILALILIMLIVTTSGLAISMARKHASSYVSRYSLERTASDAADVLVKSPGKPANWEGDVESLKTPGFAKNGEKPSGATPNFIDKEKFTQMKRLTRDKNWDPSQPEIQAIMKLFGDTENFEIETIRQNLLVRRQLADLDLEIDDTLFGVEFELEAENEDSEIEVDIELGESEKEVEDVPPFRVVVKSGRVTIEVRVREKVIEVWGRVLFQNIWPGWDEKSSSGAENSLEVATASRLIYTRYGDIRYRSDPIVRVKPGAGTEVRKDNFYLYDGELESFDWYVVVEISSREENRPRRIEVKVRDGGQLKYSWEPAQTGEQTKKVFPDFHGGLENDSPTPPPQVGSNDLHIKVWQDQQDENSGQWARIFIIGVPHCSQPETAVQSLERVTAIMKIKVWR